MYHNRAALFFACLLSGILMHSCNWSESELTDGGNMRERSEWSEFDLNDTLKQSGTGKVLRRKAIMLPEKWQSFVGTEYVALDTAQGDINLDSISDLVLVIAPKAKDTIAEKEQLPRALILLLGNKENDYDLFLRNDQALYAFDPSVMKRDPLLELSVRKGVITLEHFLALNEPYSRICSFKYDSGEKQWFLELDSKENFFGPTDKRSTVRTVRDFGIISLTNFDINLQ